MSEILLSNKEQEYLNDILFQYDSTESDIEKKKILSSMTHKNPEILAYMKSIVKCGG